MTSSVAFTSRRRRKRACHGERKHLAAVHELRPAFQAGQTARAGRSVSKLGSPSWTAAKGLEMLVLDQTRADVGLPVVKVIVPGLRHFWARFAPGRLYDVPVQLGWLDQPLRETEFNPIPMFM